MFRHLGKDHWIGLLFVVFALGLVLVWIPNDTDTGLVEKIRRQVLIGDALAPAVAGGFLLLGGLGLLLSGPDTGQGSPVDLIAMRFAALLFAVFFLSFLLMQVTGPAAVWAVNTVTGADLEYRLLRDTAPWKYLGFAAGGTTAVTAAVSLVERRLTWRAVITGAVAVAAMIAVYDLPFDDLLLPPNGDM